MRTFWLWLAFLTVALYLAVAYEPAAGGNELAWRMTFSALLLAAYFAVPLFRHRPKALTALLGISVAFAAAALWPGEGSGVNPYPLLVFGLIAGKAAYRLPGIHAAIVGAIALAGAAAPLAAGLPGLPPPFLLLLAAGLGSCLYASNRLLRERDEARARNEALLSEYRSVKRKLASGGEEARQEERAHVAREIHDSVGHKLTALLMQLELQRLEADEATKPMLEELKSLAKESLEETRGAVRTLKEDETGGLSSIMRLLRRLEAESFMRLEFTIKDGALTAPLAPRQSIAIYRAVQEALTNAMRHGVGREARITFEAPGGGSVFRFEVSNSVKQGVAFYEGFGLRGMRERIEESGGQLEARSYDGLFVVRGAYTLVNREGGAK
ncbi:MAG: sensor histidine kinase [Paenibacillus sp.]|nr:sensor histidine kinase [Paenibacillus sp.]